MVAVQQRVAVEPRITQPTEIPDVEVRIDNGELGHNQKSQTPNVQIPNKLQISGFIFGFFIEISLAFGALRFVISHLARAGDFCVLPEPLRPESVVTTVYREIGAGD